MAYCLRELPPEAQLLITEFRLYFLVLEHGGTPSAQAIRRIRWQRRRFHPERYYRRHPVWEYHHSGVWRLRSDHPTNNLFIAHDDTAEPGDPHYGRAARYAEIELGEPPTDDYEDSEHFSIGWLTESDE